MTPAETPQKAGRREWIGLAVIALPCLLYSMDLTVLNLALPAISEDLRPSSSELLWIVDIYGFLVAGLLITMGTLGDRIGRRRLLLIGAAAFGAASVLAAFSSSARDADRRPRAARRRRRDARALDAVADPQHVPRPAAAQGRDRGLDRQLLGRRRRSARWSAARCSSCFWWGSVFLIGVPVMALLLVLGPRLLPESRDPDAGRLDLASAALSLGAVLAVIYGAQAARRGRPRTGRRCSRSRPASSLAALFVRRQRRLDDPLLDLDLFRIRAFSAGLATNVLGFFAAFGLFVFIAQYLQLVLGYSPLEAGLWSLPSAFGFIAGAMLAAPVLRRRSAPPTSSAAASRSPRPASR